MGCGAVEAGSRLMGASEFIKEPFVIWTRRSGVVLEGTSMFNVYWKMSAWDRMLV